MPPRKEQNEGGIRYYLPVGADIARLHLRVGRFDLPHHLQKMSPEEEQAYVEELANLAEQLERDSGGRLKEYT